MKKICLILIGIVTCFNIYATTYPLKIKDINNRTVIIKSQPQKVAFLNGRGFSVLEIMYGNKAGDHLVAWGPDMKWGAPTMYSYYLHKYPKFKSLPELGNLSQGNFNTESFINLKNRPDILFVDKVYANDGEKSGVFQTLEKVGIPVVVYDFHDDPIKDTRKSIKLIGKVLNKENQANQYINLYNKHLSYILEKIKNQGKNYKGRKVFIEGAAGFDVGSIRTYGNADMGAFIPLLSAQNVMIKPLNGAVFGNVLPENIINYQPDVYIMASSGWKDKSGNFSEYGVSLGYPPTNMNLIKKQNNKLLSRNWMQALPAYQNKNIGTIWMVLHNSPYNIITIEYFAKWIYPELFQSLDPEKTFKEISTLDGAVMNKYPVFATQMS